MRQDLLALQVQQVQLVRMEPTVQPVQQDRLVLLVRMEPTEPTEPTVQPVQQDRRVRHLLYLDPLDQPGGRRVQ